MRTIIAGSREITDRKVLVAALSACPWRDEITEIVCGGAYGIDALGDKFARHAHLPVEYFLVATGGYYDLDRLLNKRPVDPSLLLTRRDTSVQGWGNVRIVADWASGGQAGPIRNAAMADYAEALIAVPLREAKKGTTSMIGAATTRGLRVFVHEVSR